MDITWLIVMSSADAYIYDVSVPIKKKNDKVTSFHPTSQHYRLVSHFEHPESKLKGIELRTDKEGHFSTPQTTQGKYTEPTDRHQNELEHFAKEIANYLEEGRTNNLFNQLIICAEPHFYGIVKSKMKNITKGMIKAHLLKDYIHSDKFDKNFDIDEILKKAIEAENK